MKLMRLEEMLPHRGPALMLSAVEAVRGRWIRCRADRQGPWHWPELLEASAQAAGLLAALELDSSPGLMVVAEFREVSIPDGIAMHGPAWIEATLVSHFLRFHRCRFAAHATDGEVVLGGTMTLATPPGDPSSRTRGRGGP
jgi:hypothetical protein